MDVYDAFYSENNTKLAQLLGEELNEIVITAILTFEQGIPVRISTMERHSGYSLSNERSGGRRERELPDVTSV